MEQPYRGDSPGALRSARLLARLLDDAFRVPGLGIRVGLDGLLGLIPGGGDAVGALLSSYVLLVGVRLRAPAAILLRMLLNIGVDALIGTIPLLGDAFDFGWKANVRNVALVERWVRDPQQAHEASRVAIIAIVALTLLLIAAIVGLAVWVLRLVVGAL